MTTILLRISFLLSVYSFLFFSCSGNGKSSDAESHTEAQTEATISQNNPSGSDTLPVGKGTKSTTPDSAGTGITTSENGLSTDVGGNTETTSEKNK